MASDFTTDMMLKVLCGVLEDAAFITGEPAEPTGWPQGEVMEATMHLGESMGELSLRAEAAFASLLAANLLGDEPDSPGAVAAGGEALCELLNMVAGGLVVAAGGHSLGLPKVEPRPAQESNARWQKARCRAAIVTDEGQRVEMAVWAPGGTT
jgi:hypothetical protein